MHPLMEVIVVVGDHPRVIPLMQSSSTMSRFSINKGHEPSQSLRQAQMAESSLMCSISSCRRKPEHINCQAGTANKLARVCRSIMQLKIIRKNKVINSLGKAHLEIFLLSMILHLAYQK